MKLHIRLLCLIALAIGTTTSLYAQNNQVLEVCGYQAKNSFIAELISSKAALEAYVAEHRGKSSERITFPVRMTVYRNDDGSPAGGPNAEPVTQRMIDGAFEDLNRAFAGANILFVQEGPINYIDNTKAALRVVPAHYFSFTSSNQQTSMGSSFGRRSLVRGSASMFRPNSASNSSVSGASYVYDSESLTRFHTWEHEMGHVFNLLHTFQGARLFNAPNYPLENDPGIYEDQPDVYRPHFTRELVIRSYAPGANYPEPNSDFAGDLIEDTPAWCGGYQSSVYPSSSDEDCHSYPSITTSSCSYGCDIITSSCSYVGDYVDYNGHPIDPETVDVAIRNFMSYHNADGDCRNSFTQGQLDRVSMVAQAASTVWNQEYSHNLTDTVQFRGTNIPIKNVNIMLTHLNRGENEDKITRMTTPSDGSFHGILYSSVVKSKISILGSGEKNHNYELDNDNSYDIYHYTPEDWTAGITIEDLIAVVKHTIGQELLDGYGQIAADVDNNGVVDIYDVIAIRNVIYGGVESFDKVQSGPWKFIPEFITNWHRDAFHDDPFGMEISGVRYINEAPYTRGDWYYKTPDGFSGYAGYDGVKIGDVDGSAMSETEESDLNVLTLSSSKDADEYVVLNFSATDFEDIVAMQLGLTFDDEALELLGVKSVLNGFNDVPSFSTTNNGEYVKHQHKRKNGNDELRIFWNDPMIAPNTIADGSAMFQLYFKTKRSIADLNDVLYINREILPVGFYDKDGDILPMEIEVSEVFSEQYALASSDIYADAYLVTKGKAAAVEAEDHPSKIASIDNLICAPNPVKDMLTVAFRSDQSAIEGQLVIVDVNGRVLKQQPVNLTKGINKISIQTADMPKGMLLVSILTEEAQCSKRFVKI